MSSKIYLQNVELKWNTPVLVASLIFVGVSVVIASVLSYYLSFVYGGFGVFVGSSIGALIGIFANALLLTSQKLIKDVAIEITETIHLKDSIKIEVRDRDGNLKYVYESD